MKVSVVIPVYNKAPFLQACLESICSQTFRDLEVICVDDRSTDNSLEVLRGYSDPRLRIIEMAVNSGPGGAANAGLDAAQGEYIVRMDADDIAVPERIALQVAYMDAHPETGASGGQLQLFGSEADAWTFPVAPEACAAQLFFGVPVAQPASILRRSVLQAHHLRYGAQWPRVGEDWLFWLQMAPYTRFGNLPDVLVHYRRGPQNISQGRDRVADFTYLQREAFRTLGIPCTAEELNLHLMGSMIFAVKPTAQRVQALRRWYNKLIAMNSERHFAPEQAFARRVEEQWEKLYHYLPRYGLAASMAHLRFGHCSPAKISYALKYRINARLGKLPNG